MNLAQSTTCGNDQGSVTLGEKLDAYPVPRRRDGPHVGSAHRAAARRGVTAGAACPMRLKSGSASPDEGDRAADDDRVSDTGEVANRQA